MNLLNIKKEFPIFNNKNLVYLDSANSSQKPQSVINRINDFYSNEFSNVGRSVHYLAVAATNLYENTRISVQKYINAKDKNEIVFTKGATEAINLVANTFGQKYLKAGDEVLTTTQDYGRMIATFKQRECRDGIVMKQFKIPIPAENENEIVRLFEKNITPKTKMILMCHMINITGQILPVKKVVRMAKKYNIPVIVDGAHTFAHFDFNLDDLECDYYATSLHKWLSAPFGTGMLLSLIHI